MSRPTHIVYPGYVISVNDGGRHYLGFGRLCELAGIRQDQAIDAGREGILQGMSADQRAALIPVRPRRDGDYRPDPAPGTACGCGATGPWRYMGCYDATNGWQCMACGAKTMQAHISGTPYEDPHHRF